MSKGSGISGADDPNNVGKIEAMDAEFNFKRTDDRETVIDDSMSQISNDIIFWGSQDPTKLYYGKTIYEITADLNTRYKALEKEKENLSDSKDEFLDKEY